MHAKHYNLILQYAYLIIISQYLNLAYSSQCDQSDNVTQPVDTRDENFVQKNISSMTSTVNSTDFFVDGTRIVAESSGRYGFIEYMWDAQGVTGMRRGGRNYFFVRDVFGNVVEVLRETDGEVVARYRYDAWGNHVITNADGIVIYVSGLGVTEGFEMHIGVINPWRYRGYYMDRGTGLYYLQTRFYDPVVRRFVNADNFMLLPLLAGQMGGLNMFAYSLNNPVMHTDSTGQLVITASILLKAALIGAIVGGVIGGAAGGIHAALNGQNILAGIGIGFAFGALAGAGAAVGGKFMGAFSAFKAGTMTFGAALKSAGFGASVAFTTGAVSGFGNHLAFQRLGNRGVELDAQAAARAGLIRGGFNVFGAALGNIFIFNDTVLDVSAGLSIDIFLDILNNIWENAPSRNMPILARYS